MVELNAGVVFLGSLISVFGGSFWPMFFTGVMAVLSALAIKTKGRKFVYFGFVGVGIIFVLSFFGATIYGIGPMLSYIITSQNTVMLTVNNLGQSTVPSIILMIGFLKSKKQEMKN